MAAMAAMAAMGKKIAPCQMLQSVIADPLTV
jgi:hypothetical protein